MKPIFLKLVLAMVAITLGGIALAEEKILKMSTTTSTRDSGLLDVLLPVFEADTGIRVKVIAKGTGAAIRDGMDGNVDILFVHAKDREEQFVADGFGTRRYPVMYNDFIIIGPKKDPAGVDGTTNAARAFQKIAESESPFVSRGDDSGTHTKEQAIWKAAVVPMVRETREIVKQGATTTITASHPQKPGTWYLSIGQGMGAVLTFAEEKQTYTLTDRGTYLAYKYARPQGMDLDILCEGDSRLKNEYGLIPVNPQKFPHVRHNLAKQFADWITGEKGQALIADYKIFGNQLFYPDAGDPGEKGPNS